MKLSKNKVIGGVVGLLAIVSIVNTQAILKLTNFITGDSSGGVSLDGSKQSAQVVNFSTKITEGQTYKRGDKSADVQKVQQALTTQGIYKGAVSGTFGPQTERAVMDFQTKNGLRATGILDTNTINLVLRDGDRPGPGFQTAQCNSNTQPWIRVISPNGGEVYQAGQQINVTWTSCNVPSDVDVGITLKNIVGMQNIHHIIDGQFPNNGSAIINAVPLPGMPPFVFGNNFKVELTYVVNSGGPTENIIPMPAWLNQGDESNNLFSIAEGGAPTTSECNAKVLYPHPGQTYTLAENSTPAGGDIEVFGFVLVASDPANCVWDTAGSLIPTASNPPSGSGGLVTILESGGQTYSPLFITGNYNFSDPDIGNRLYSQSIYFNQETYPAGEYNLQFTDMNNQNPIIIPINIQY